MPCYRFDFLAASGDTFATHEIDYPDDQAAIAAGHEINGRRQSVTASRFGEMTASSITIAMSR
jgi:hypothetical protein